MKMNYTKSRPVLIRVLGLVLAILAGLYIPHATAQCSNTAISITPITANTIPSQ